MTRARQGLNGSSSTSPASSDTQTKTDIDAASKGKTVSGRASTNTGLAFSGTTESDRRGGSNGEQILADAGFRPIPNLMSELFQPTYHFRFFLPSDIGTDLTNSVTIAETGLTGMNIQDVTIETFIGPNSRTRNATATSITIKIYEPFGNLLPDIMYQAAGVMAIANYLKAPWMLELKLHGYDESGAYKLVEGSPWRWRVVMTDMQSQISETGTTHTITCLPLMEVALNNQYCMLPNAKSISGNTVGEVLQNIVKGMNEDSKIRYGGPPYFIEYAVEDVPYRSDQSATVSSPFEHRIISDQPSKNDSRTAPNRSTSIAQFAPGTDIPSIVDNLMASTVSGVEQTRISRSIKPDGDGLDSEKEVKSVVSVMHRVDTKVEITGYNKILGDYSRKITYVVRPYDSLRLLTSMGRAQNFDKDDQLQIKKAAYATKRNFLKKSYDYIFTGLNTEIEKFDIVVNFRWAVMVPRLQGFGGYGNITVPAEVSDEWLQETAATLQAQAGEIEKLKSQLSTETPVPDPNDPDNEDSALFSNGRTRAQLTADLARLKEDNTKLLNAYNPLARATITADETNRAAARRANVNGAIVIEDDVKAVIQGTGSGLSGDLSPLPITIHQDGDNPAIDTANSTLSMNNNGKSIYGTLLNQLYGTMDGNLQNITLDIKGDPYWLGPGVDAEVIKDESSDNRPVFMNGEHMFAFRFKLPQGYNEQTGTVSLPTTEEALKGNTNIVTGFYATIQVVNKFSGGAFKQTLSAVRIPGWKYEQILLGKIDPEDPSNQSDPATSSTPAATSTSSARNTGGTRKTRGQRNNNPGNLRDSSFSRRQPGYIGTDGDGFAQYDTTANGIRAQETLLRANYLNRPTTVSAVIERYAPGNENSAASRSNYIAFVTQRLGKSNLTASDTVALASAMRAFENGVG